VRPPQARREKPRVSAFTSANIDKILALKTDLVLTFSDLQAGITADLIRRGPDVHALNQRPEASVELQSIVTRSRCSSRQLRRTAEMGGLRTFANSTANDKVA
jgi:ABC-type Fe3+-hydroxamate transport system substrate-binding protein